MLDGDMNERQAIRMAHDMHSGDTERRILDSARRLFAEKGYEKIESLSNISLLCVVASVGYVPMPL